MPANAPLKSKEKSYTYKSSEYQSKIEDLFSGGISQTLLSFIGPYMPDKTSAVKAISEQTDRTIKHFDLKELVHKSTDITLENITQAFQDADPRHDLYLFTNGANLCGNYMGNTFSKIKYATPEERYFLDQIEAFDSITVVTIRSDDAADETIKRKSDAIIHFPLPSSPLKRFSWKLRNYTFHGFKLPDERTEIT